jgi:small GTP-binding protein
MKNLEDEDIKVILVGESGTGKTSLINVAMGMKFQEGVELSTSSASFVTKIIKIGGKSYSLNLWDTIGQEKFRSLTKIFIKDSKIVIFVYDITNSRSFQELDFWFKTIQDVLGDTPILGICGNKQDLFVKEQVSEEKAQKYAEDKGVLFKLTSAKNPLSFNTFLEDLLKKFIEKSGGVIESSGGQKLEENKEVTTGKGMKCCNK